MDLNIGEHLTGNILGFNVHLDTLITLWLSMLIILLFSFFATVKTRIIPNKIQSVFENIVSFFVDLTKEMGEQQGISALVLLCLFLLIITSNLIGQFPFRIFNISNAELASPTNDINTTAALAIFVLIFYICKGIKSKGLAYFKHYIQPVWFMVPFNILEDFTRPLTLMLRLFANILAGEILIMVLTMLVSSLLTPQIIQSMTWFNFLPEQITYNIFLFLGSLLPLPIMFFELFVAFVQALVFTLLANAYIQNAVIKEH